MGSILTTVHRLTLSPRCRVNQYSGTCPLGKCRYVENQYSCVITSHFNQGGWDMTPWQLSRERHCTMAWISMGSGETGADENSTTQPTGICSFLGCPPPFCFVFFFLSPILVFQIEFLTFLNTDQGSFLESTEMVRQLNLFPLSKPELEPVSVPELNQSSI